MTRDNLEPTITVTIQRTTDISVALKQPVSTANKALLQNMAQAYAEQMSNNELMTLITHEAGVMQAADDAVTARWPSLPGVRVIHHVQAWWPEENSDQTIELAKISVALPPRIVLEHIEALVAGDSAELDVLYDKLYLHTQHPQGSGPYWIEPTNNSREGLQVWWETHEHELAQEREPAQTKKEQS